MAHKALLVKQVQLELQEWQVQRVLLEPPAQLVLKVSKEFKDKTAPLDRTVLLVPLERKARKGIKVSRESKVTKESKVYREIKESKEYRVLLD
tara:strand:+ start:194 stop:472 length:279 start_codon:yes stop_codon:yes gene_type:complete